MRKLKNLLVLSALALALAACSPSPAEEVDGAELEEVEEAEETEETEAEQDEEEPEEAEEDSEDDAVFQAVLFSKAIHTDLTDGGAAVLYMTVPDLSQEVGQAILEEKAAMYGKDDREFTEVTIYFYPEDYEAPADGAPNTEEALGQAHQVLAEEAGTVTIK